MTESTELEKAIAVLEAQRRLLGDAVVDTAITPLREKLAALEQGASRSAPSLPAEHKLITILFADVVGSTAMGSRLDAETSRLIMNRCLQRMSQAVDEFGGTVAKLMGDGMLAFFGVPKANEDDPERAVLAANLIQKNVAELAAELAQPIQVRVGVNTGRVVVGEMGGEIYTEYTAMGQPVNLAARLESAATPGQTLLGESTARMVRYRFRVEPLEPLSLKGFAEPVRAFSLLGEHEDEELERGIVGRHTALVGRDVELDRLTGMMAGLDKGRGGIVALMGEPGIGKSRLLQDAKEKFDDGRLRFAEGRSYSYSEEQPFSVILDLLADLLDIAADDSPALLDLKLEAKLTSLFEDDLEGVWPYLATLLDAPVPSQYASLLIGLDPEALNAKILSAVTLLVEKMAARRPLVLSFDDLQWADGSSLNLTGSLFGASENVPVLLILIFRPDRDKPCWTLKLQAETHFAHRYLELSLTPLDGGETLELVDNLLRASDLPSQLLDMIREKSEGNPFFVEELIQVLIEREVIVHRGETWSMASQIAELEVPETLEKLIQARFDRLPPQERATMQAASVIGRRFAFRVLESMAVAHVDLRRQLLRLQQADLIRERTRLPELEYIFKHVIVQEVTYSTLLSERRRELHRLAAESLEVLFPDRREELLGTLAQHYAAAGEKGKAIPLFLQAAQRARAVYAYEEALHYLVSAQALSETESLSLPEKLTLLEELADMHRLLREQPEAIRLYQDALKLIEHPLDNHEWTAVRLHRKICESWEHIYIREDIQRLKIQAQSSLRIGLKLVDGEPPHLETVRLLTVAYWCATDWQSDDPEWSSAETYARAAVEMAEQLDIPVELSAALDTVAAVYARQGQVREHLQVHQRRLELSRDQRFDNLREKIDIVIMNAIALMGVGYYAQAVPHLLEAEELGEQIQDPFSQTKALRYQAECWARLDRWDDVLIAEEKMMSLRRHFPLEKLGGICWLLAFSGAVHALRGESDLAAQLRQESYDIMIAHAGGSEESWSSAPHY